LASTNSVQSGKVPRNIQILHNTILQSTADFCFRALGWTSTTQGTYTVANNAFFCNLRNNAFSVPFDMSKQTWFGNAFIGGSAPQGVNTTTGAFLVGTPDVELANPTANDYYPSTGSKLINAGNSAYTTATDYNCNTRTSTSGSVTIGAFQYQQAKNPGYTAVPFGFKLCAPGSVQPSQSQSKPNSAATSVMGINSLLMTMLAAAVILLFL